MSLVPYSSRDSREIVLRHNDAIVIRDPQTQQLILRGTTNSSFDDSNCPTCHRPLRNSSHERSTSPHRSSPLATPYISPEYFRMLQVTNGGADEHNPPSSPIRRLVQPAFPSVGSDGAGSSSVSEAEFVTSTPAPQTGHSIKKKALSQNYFKTFFIEEQELGRGGKGVVLLVRHVLDGVDLGQFACKRVPVGDDHLWLEKVLIEVQLLQGLSHPNLVSYRHVWLEDVKLNRFSPSIPCAFILQQYCNSGDLLHYIVGQSPKATSTKEILKEQMRRRSRGHSDRPSLQTQRKLSFEEIYSFFKDITSGLAHLHAANYIHRDLKPSNCLLHKDGNDLKCLISDFGEVQAENVVRKSTGKLFGNIPSIMIPQGNPYELQRSKPLILHIRPTGSTGTISYCAPEVLKKDEFGRYGNFSTKSDIFSLGMILFFMCFGRLPYKSADSIQEEFEDIDLLRAEISAWSGFQDARRERPELPGQLYSFLKRLLALNPTDRPSASEILHALRTEKGLDNPPRSRNGSAAGLTGRIIQSIDSPIPPGSPVIEPTKRMNSRPYTEDPSKTDNSSPASSPSQQLVLESVHRLPNQSHPSPRLKATIRTPLLMAPPASFSSRVKHQVSLYQHYLRSWATVNQQSLHLLLRLLIFAFKIASITKPCRPVATREAVWYPLIGLAALELALGAKLRWKISLMFAVVHALVLAWVSKFGGGGLCVVDNRLRRVQDDWRHRDET